MGVPLNPHPQPLLLFPELPEQLSCLSGSGVLAQALTNQGIEGQEFDFHSLPNEIDGPAQAASTRYVHVAPPCNSQHLGWQVTPPSEQSRNMLVRVDFCARRLWAWSVDCGAATISNIQGIPIRPAPDLKYRAFASPTCIDCLTEFLQQSSCLSFQKSLIQRYFTDFDLPFRWHVFRSSGHP